MAEMFEGNPKLLFETIQLKLSENNELPTEFEKNISEKAFLIKKLPRREIRECLEKILMSDTAEITLRALFRCGILKFILPELDRCFYEKQKNKYHIYNVGEHILHVVSGTPKILSLRWAALLHDVGKPLCASCDSSGVIHFYGHHSESRKIADDIAHRYGFSDELRREVCTLIEYHDVHFEQSEVGVKRALSRMGEKQFLKLLDLQEADIRAKNPIFIEAKCKSVNNLRRICMEVIKKGEPYRYSDLAIGRRELMKMKFRAEREMRDVLRVLFDEVVENPSLNRRDYLLSRAKALKNKR